MKRIYILLLLFWVSAGAQNIPELEQELYENRKHISRLGQRLDSLKLELESLLQEIDREKERSDADQNHLAALMSAALERTDQVDNLETERGKLFDQLDTINRKLDLLYTMRIDSLEDAIKATGDVSRKQELERSHLQYTLKRMQVLPNLPKLSFDPLMLESFSTDSLKTPLDHDIYADFLSRARSELENHYTLIDKLETELTNLIRLEEKALTFMEDVEDGTLLPLGGLASGNVSDAQVESYQNGIIDFRGSEKDLGVSIPVHSLITLNNQLSGYSNQALTGRDAEALSNEEKLELLINIKESLDYYLQITTRKLDQH